MMMNNPYSMPLQAPYSQQMNMGAYQNANLFGKPVNDFNEITANDVPMNGNCAYFPKNDSSAIQIRRWTPNGTIETQTYVKSDNVPRQPTEMELLTDRVTKLEEAISRKVKQNEPTNNAKQDTE